MRAYAFTVGIVLAVLVLLSMPPGSTAFVSTRQNCWELRPNPMLETSSGIGRVNRSALAQAKKMDSKSNNAVGQSNDNMAFAMLSTDRDSTPNKGNFFYNDEVASHLYGYMYLVGLIVAQDGLFLGLFLVLSTASAWATQASMLPCNPRIPGLTAALTFGLTILVRYGMGVEPPLAELLGDTYQGPADSAAWFELAICLLNVGWGFFGSWRTKEQVNGATYGF